MTRIEGVGPRRARRARRWRRQSSATSCVAGIGVTPRIELARAAGLEVDDGVSSTGTCRRARRAIFAAGDIANFPHPLYGGRRMRVEHWANAGDQGPAAARAMLGSNDVWQRVPYFFSDQYDVGMEFAGDLAEAERIVVRGDMASREFVASGSPATVSSRA